MILLIPNTPVLQAVFNSQPIRETPEIVFGEWNTMEMEQYKQNFKKNDYSLSLLIAHNNKKSNFISWTLKARGLSAHNP